MFADLPAFDAGTLDYDRTKFRFAEWALARVREAGYPQVDDLSRLHEHVKFEDMPTLTKRLIREAGGPEFMRMAIDFVATYVKPMVGDVELAIQRYPNVRVVLPDRPDMILPFHQGIWVGNGMGIGTVWMPLTRAFDSNSMWIIELAKSRELTRRAIEEKWNREQMQEVLLSQAHPMNLELGEVCTFCQANIHGNVANLTGVTRVSVDFRVLEAQGQFHRKLPGGYFVLSDRFDDLFRTEPRENGAGAARAKSIISYCENNTRITRGINVYLQRLLIRDYCQERNIKFRYEQMELEGLLHCPILMGVLEHDAPDEVVMFSYYALPEDPGDRKRLLDKAIEKRIVMHFVNELEVMRTPEDRDRIERTMRFSTDFSSPVIRTA
jgi:sporadic carbohydrate cluster 2OG-Fe(II) oxygenase/sporadic carbohydrate cluster protein (TIGR04323 family)